MLVCIMNMLTVIMVKEYSYLVNQKEEVDGLPTLS
jgi:hypothetical protein